MTGLLHFVLPGFVVVLGGCSSATPPPQEPSPRETTLDDEPSPMPAPYVPGASFGARDVIPGFIEDVDVCVQDDDCVATREADCCWCCSCTAAAYAVSRAALAEFQSWCMVGADCAAPGCQSSECPVCDSTPSEHTPARCLDGHCVL